jgi:hypothetical protein
MASPLEGTTAGDLANKSLGQYPGVFDIVEDVVIRNVTVRQASSSF